MSWSPSDNSLASKSILRNSVVRSPVSNKKIKSGEIKKKVSICAPSPTVTVANKKESRKIKKMKTKKLVKSRSLDQETLESDHCKMAPILDISSQIRSIIDAARDYLIKLFPGTRI